MRGVAMPDTSVDHRAKLPLASEWARKGKIGLVAYYVTLGLVVTLLIFLRPVATGEKVRASDYGSTWPLSVTEGMLHCVAGGVITFVKDGTEYSLVRRSQHSAYADVEGIRAVDPGGSRKDLGPLIERGRRLCD